MSGSSLTYDSSFFRAGVISLRRDKEDEAMIRGTEGHLRSREGSAPMPIAALANYDALSAMITPAIFLTANASLIISTSNRMSRAVDRIRVLNDLADKHDLGKTALDYTAERLGHAHDQLRRLER